MKRILILIMTLFVFSGCADKGQGNLVNEKFVFNSVLWGTAWEDIKDKTEDYKVVADDGYRFAVEISNVRYLGVDGKAMMIFSVSEKNYPETGLTEVYFVYEDDVEEQLINKAEERFGKRMTSVLSKDGSAEEPLNPPAWYCDETIEEKLDDTKKEKYVKILKDRNYSETQITSAMRGRLVIITPDEDRNTIRLQGGNASVVQNLVK